MLVLLSDVVGLHWTGLHQTGRINLLSPCNLLRLDTCVRFACSISDPDNNEVIITGGDNNRKKVSVYNELRWQRDLAPLNQERSYHGCGSYRNGGKKVSKPNCLGSYIFDRNIQFSVTYGHWGTHRMHRSDWDCQHRDLQ